MSKVFKVLKNIPYTCVAKSHHSATQAVMDQEGGTGGPGPLPPLKNHKNIGFLSNTGPDHLKITKLPSQHSMLGHHRNASETPFKWCFAGGPMMARL